MQVIGLLGGMSWESTAVYCALLNRMVRERLGAHLRSSGAASQLSRWPALMDAAVRAAATDQRVFDDVVALGLADGRLTARTLAATVRRLR